jgi:hypothetical protein
MPCVVMWFQHPAGILVHFGGEEDVCFSVRCTTGVVGCTHHGVVSQPVHVGLHGPVQRDPASWFWSLGESCKLLAESASRPLSGF